MRESQRIFEVFFCFEDAKNRGSVDQSGELGIKVHSRNFDFADFRGSEKDFLITHFSNRTIHTIRTNFHQFFKLYICVSSKENHNQNVNVKENKSGDYYYYYYYYYIITYFLFVCLFVN